MDKEAKVVWQNECRLVFRREGDEEIGEMGLCDRLAEGRHHEVQVSVRETGDPPQRTLDRLRDVPVRITIERVPGGHS